jgi:hypothetical protein
VFRLSAAAPQSASRVGLEPHSRRNGRARPIDRCIAVVRKALRAIASASMSASWRAASALPRPSQVAKTTATSLRIVCLERFLADLILAAATPGK